ncbi:hypothetical protein ACFLTL_00400 [Chloroflexota bacterium]
MRRRQFRVFITGVLLAAVVAAGGCAPVDDFDRSLKAIVEPYAFSIIGWELVSLPQEIDEWLFVRPDTAVDDVDTVTGYFASVERIKALESVIAAVRSGDRQGDAIFLEAELDGLRREAASLAPVVEGIIGRQVKEILTRQGIHNPLLRLEVSFPPVSFNLSDPPHLLVVSPRDSIESVREYRLRQNVSAAEAADIEEEVDSLGVSSLVAELGGFGGTFPTFVSNRYGLQFAIDTVVEEWLHQYLTFTPLGFLYLLDSSGIAPDYDIATINETAAGIVSQEIGEVVYDEYYSHLDSVREPGPEPEFDFNAEMRQIRLAVDDYLARGEVEPAEAFMEERRQYLAANGYYIRKLNQAYFAFYGTYADSPTSVSPIGVEMRDLRSRSGSVKDFLDNVVKITSRQDLQESIK